MKKTSWLFVVLFISINISAISEAKSDEKSLPAIPLEKKSFQEKKDKNYKEGEIIVQYKSKIKREQALAKIKDLTDKKDLALEVKGEIDDLNIALIKSSTKSTADLIEEFKTDETVEFSEPNYKRELTFEPDDSLFYLEWSLNNIGQEVQGVFGTADADIDAAEAWDIESSSATSTVVAVIDNGTQYSHPDLINNMWDGTICVSELGVPIDGGCPNHGWDYENYDNDPYGEQHGTFVASLIAGENGNGLGISGLSRYNHVRVMALKFDLTVFTELKAISFAKNNGAKVINASFVGTDYSLAEKDLIDNFNGIFVAAAGNSSNNNDIAAFYPCSYTSANIICVASSSQNDTLSSFSNYGTVGVDIMAPGENILGIYNNSYYTSGGTSYSAPLVSGTVALLYSHRPTASAATIRETLLKSSDHFSAYSNSVYCGRRLNTKTSLQSIINNTIPAESCFYPMYRFRNKNDGSYLFTAEEEKDSVLANYSQTFELEGLAFYASTSGSPMYRFRNKTNGTYLFTGEEEKNSVLANYSQTFELEGLAFYASTSGSPMYRFRNKTNGTYLFTGEEEKNSVLANYSQTFELEGLAFYGAN